VKGATINDVTYEEVAEFINLGTLISNNNNNNNNIYSLQLGCYQVAVVILHVNKTLNWLLLNLSREGYLRSM